MYHGSTNPSTCKKKTGSLSIILYTPNWHFYWAFYHNHSVSNSFFTHNIVLKHITGKRTFKDWRSQAFLEKLKHQKNQKHAELKFGVPSKHAELKFGVPRRSQGVPSAQRNKAKKEERISSLFDFRFFIL